MMNISLTPELERMVLARMASGRYRTPVEVVREALQLLEEQELDPECMRDEVRAKIAIGLQQAYRGELLDGEEVFKELSACAASP